MNSENGNRKNKDSVSHYMSLVTTHGCQQIYYSKSKLTKICWTMFLLASIFVAGYFLSMAINKYFKYRTTDETSLRDSYVDFPAVTVCKLDNDGFSRVATSHYVLDDVHGTQLWQDLQVLKNVFEKKPDHEDQELTVLIENFAERLVDSQSIPQAFPGIMEHLMSDYERFIVSCQFKDQGCNKTHFVKRTRGEYFNCFTFNHHSGTIKKNGPSSGLSMVFYLDTLKEMELEKFPIDDSSLSFTDSGIKVAIHEPNTIPDIRNDGFIVAPGYSTNIALKQSVVKKMEPPWGECDESRVKISDIANEDTDIVYNRETCMKICKQRYIHGKCGCLNIMLPVPNDLKNEKFCFYLNKYDILQKSSNWTNAISETVKRSDCENKYLEDLPDSYESQYGCNCPLSCMYKRYNSLISQAKWPPQNVVHRFVKKFMNDHPTLLNGTEIEKAYEGNDTCSSLYETVQKNFLRLNVYHRSLTVKTTTQVEAFTIQDLISEVGRIIAIIIRNSGKKVNKRSVELDSLSKNP